MSVLTAIFIIILTYYVISQVIEHYFIKALDNLSDWLKLSPSVEGATLMAFGTSAPELSIALVALFLPGSHVATGLGSVVGSALFQTLVVIGFAAIIHKTVLSWKPILRDCLFYLLAITLLIFSLKDGIVTQTEALMFIGTYLIYLIVLFTWSRLVKEEDEPDPLDIVEKEIIEQERKVKKSNIQLMLETITDPIDNFLSLIPDASKHPIWTLPVFLISIAIIAYGGYWLVIAAEALANNIGLSPAIISLTVLAVGGSLPELITSSIVVRQGRGTMAVSNALGSNVFDLLIGFGLPVYIWTSINGPLGGIGDSNIHTSSILMFATVIVLFVLLALRHFRLGRYTGFILIFIYIAYVFATYAGWLENIPLLM